MSIIVNSPDITMYFSGLINKGNTHHYWRTPAGSIWFVPKNTQQAWATCQLFSAFGLAKLVLGVWSFGLPFGECAGLEKNELESLRQSINQLSISSLACYIGTPGAYRKAILGIWESHSFSIVVKLSLSINTDDVVLREANTLFRLNKLGFTYPVPEILGVSEWKGRALFYMKPIEGKSGPVILSQLHIDWCASLFRLEKILTQWEISSCRNEFIQTIDSISFTNQKIFQQCLTWLDWRLRNRQITLGWSHRDFAPWNTRVYKNKLVAFDWENANPSRPPGYDLIHFLAIQSALNRKSFSLPIHVLEYFLEKNAPEWLGAEDAIYMIYLLDQALFYFVARTKSNQGNSQVLNWLLIQMIILQSKEKNNP